MHALKWPINCTRTRTTATAGQNTVVEQHQQNVARSLAETFGDTTGAFAYNP